MLLGPDTYTAVFSAAALFTFASAAVFKAMGFRWVFKAKTADTAPGEDTALEPIR
eukprot:gene28435-64547_t